MNKEIYVFLDTMIFLHYKPIEEINLPRILDAEKVIIVIPRITIQELDKQKNTHQQQRVRERAKNVLKKIEKWIQEETIIKDGTKISYYKKFPQKINFDEFGLNQNWNDDILLATILQFSSENPTAIIQLLSQDTGPRLTAQHLGIFAREFPSEFMLPVISDPLEKENLDLKKEIKKLQSSLPQLIICFGGRETAESFAKFQLKRNDEIIKKKVQKKLVDALQKYPKRNKEIEVNSNNALFASAINSFAKIQADEIERYNNEVDDYIKKYKKYLEEYSRIGEIVGKTINFQLKIENIGTAPADDVDFYFYFPDGFTLSEKCPSLPKEPIPPVAPRTWQQIIQGGMNLHNLGNYSSILQPIMPKIGVPKTFTLKKTNSYEIKDQTERIKQGGQFFLPELFLIFDSFETANSFACEYKIQPANLPGPIEGKLNFIIEKED